MKQSELINFSENKHKEGYWKSRNFFGGNFFKSAIIGFLSFKRAGVREVALKSMPDDMVLDLGAGAGSYAKWFKSINSTTKIVALDWSFTALSEIPNDINILRVRADAHHLPFKKNSFSSAYSIDTFGHLKNLEHTLEELADVTKKDGILFLHSESSDYRTRWPDNRFIKFFRKDLIAEKDGHFFIKRSNALKKLYQDNFIILKLYSPAGITGWLTGYPEDYFSLFKATNQMIPFIFTISFAFLKKISLFNYSLLILNSLINRLELLLNISGGGSTFAKLINR